MDADAHSMSEARSGDASSQIAKLERERDEYKKLVRLLQEENERLKRGLLGQKGERLPRNDAHPPSGLHSSAQPADPKTLATSPAYTTSRASTARPIPRQAMAGPNAE